MNAAATDKVIIHCDTALREYEAEVLEREAAHAERMRQRAEASRQIRESYGTALL